MNARPILLIAGTNRPNANALRVARVLEGHYRTAGIVVDLFSLTDLPKEVFDGSAYAVKPQSMLAIQERVLDARGLHVVTPEYNGSFPGVLKYFIDMLKFPESFERKPVAFTGESAGMWGAIRSIEQLQMIFGYRNAHIYPERVFIPGIGQRFSASGEFIDAGINERLQNQAVGFAAFAERF